MSPEGGGICVFAIATKLLEFKPVSLSPLPVPLPLPLPSNDTGSRNLLCMVRLSHDAGRDSSSSTLKIPQRSLFEAMAAMTVLKSCT